MFANAFVLLALAGTVPAAAPQAAPPAAAPPAQCARLASEAEELRAQRSSAGGRRAGGFLAGLASRALPYAPSVDVGDNVLARAAGQALESEAHDRVRGGLDRAEEGGRAAGGSNAEARLREIEAETTRLNCPAA